MTNYKKISTRASESATFRLTKDEKQLLEYLSELENVSNTDLFRSLLMRRARELDITALPPKQKKRKPGRPKKVHLGNSHPRSQAPQMQVPKAQASQSQAPQSQAPHSQASHSQASHSQASHSQAPHSQALSMDMGAIAHSQRPSALQYVEKFNQEVLPTPEEIKPQTLGELATAFRGHFSGRAEGTRRELEETLQFLIFDKHLETLIPPHIPLHQLDASRMIGVRNAVKNAEIKFSKKNLHLTYFRMMLQWAIKEEYMEPSTNPPSDLQAFTAKEIKDAWS